MAFNFFVRGKRSTDNNLKSRLEKIRSGNTGLRQIFIEENSNFINKTVSLTLGKSIVPRNSREFDIGISAFNHSIDSFDLNSNNDFFSYAEKLIKEQIYYYSFQNLKDSKKQTSTCCNLDVHHPYSTVEDLEEIALFKENLWKCGITLKVLSQFSPVNPKIIGICLRTAREIAQNDELFNKLISLKKVPVDSLNIDLKLSKQVIKKNNDYITALSFLMRSNLEIIKSYIKNREMHWKLFNDVGIVFETTGNETIVFTGKCRFLTSKKLEHAKVGYQLKSDRFSKGAFFLYVKRYLPYAAAIAVIIASILSIKNIDFDKLTGDSDVQSKEVFSASSPVSPKVKNSSVKNSAGAKQNNTPENKKVTSAKNTPKSAMPAPTDIKKPTTANKQNNPDIPKATPSEKAPDSPTPVSTTAPSIEPITSPESFPTVKATGAPGRPRLSSDSYEVKLGDDYTITMRMYQGNNGTMWKLYENGNLIASLHSADNSPNDQAASRIITPKSAGNYTYRCELSNSFGSTSSSTIEVVVNE